MSTWRTLTKHEVAKQRRRADMSLEDRKKRRNILRKNTGKHLLMHEVLAKAKNFAAMVKPIMPLDTIAATEV